MSDTKNKSNNQSNQSDLTDLGAFWKKNKNGKTFLSGKLKIGDNEFTAFIFANNKTKPNQPDYRLTVSNLSEDLIPAAKALNINKTSSANNQISEQDPTELQDDIPF